MTNRETAMTVRGIGGVFFRSKEPKKLQKWYEKKLGLKPDDGGYIYFMWKDLKPPGYTIWAPFPEDTDYFGSPGADSMINFVVSDIEQFFEELRKNGVTVDERGIEETAQGKFAWIFDLEGNKVELWEPIEEQ